MAFLIFSKNGPEDSFLLGDNQVIIGRASDCGLTINSNKLSRKHCKIYPGKNVYIVEDLGSANGTLVNGKKTFEPTNLKQGDIIRIGDTVAHFSWHPDLEIKKETKIVEGEKAFAVLKLHSAPKNVELPKLFTLKPGKYTIGRKPTSDIRINFKSVSGTHCRLTVDAESITVEDLNSTNGTKINNIKITEPKELSDGDIIQFEKLKYILSMQSERQDLSKDDILFVDEEKKQTAVSAKEQQKVTEPKLDFIDDEIKFDEPDDNGLDITFDEEPAPEQQRQDAIKMFEEIGHSDQIDVSQSDNLEEELKKEVKEFLGEGVKKKKGLKSYMLLFFELSFVLAAIIVVIVLINQGSIPPEVEVDFTKIPPQADSLITNNWSFEEGAGTDELEIKDWVSNITDSDYVYTEITDSPKSGRACLRIDRNEQSMKQSVVYYKHPIKINPGATYSMQYAIKNLDDMGAAGMRILFFTDDAGNNDNFIKSEFVGDCIRSTNDKWQDVSATVISPASANSARIALTVFGGECIFQFDDIAMISQGSTKTAAPDYFEISNDNYTVKLNSTGMFSVYTNEDEEREYLIRDSLWILHHKNTDRLVYLTEYTKNLRIKKLPGDSNSLQCEGILLNPLGNNAGSQIPYFFIISLINQNTVSVRIKFDVSNPYSYGIAFFLDEINGELYNSVFNTAGKKTSVNYYNLPIHDVFNQPIPFITVSIPLLNKYVAIDSLFYSRFQADYFDNRIQIVTKQKGDESSYLLQFAYNDVENKRINAEIEKAIENDEVTLAVAYLYEQLEINLHNPQEFKRILDRINTLSSELFSKKEEFQGILDNLENNPSVLLFSHAQNLGIELGKALENEKFANLKLDFNNKYEIRSEYQYYIDEIVNKVNKLREISKIIKDFVEKYRGKIDYAYMLRAENSAKKLLSRAYDYYEKDSEETSMESEKFQAITLFEQIVRLHPFTRPATVARKELVDIAFSLNQKADEISQTQQELANQYRALAIELCKKVLNKQFTTAGGETQNYWNSAKKSWTEIAQDIITSFYEISKDEENDGVDDEEDYELVDDFEDWSKEKWEIEEAEARETIETFINQIEKNISELPEPTKLPEPENFGDDDDDDIDDDEDDEDD
ncbi:MAG: FHA domain-containing protein [Planctomycetes bacterium]|nr:FHA domain-containing protein [Planctomycetota bacterium]